MSSNRSINHNQKKGESPARVLVASELYYPEQTSTGHVMTAIAEYLARTCKVTVLSGQPGYSQKAAAAPRVEARNGVTIRRCVSTMFDKNSLFGRAINAVTISVSVFVQALKQLKPADVALVVTNPPSLPLVILAACKARRAKCVVLVHDVYPEAMIATGVLRRGSVIARATALVMKFLLRHVDHIITIGRDMTAVIEGKVSARSVPITMIPNWADSDVVALPTGSNPVLAALGWADKFVVQYSGNMGRPHAIEDVLEAVTKLQGEADIRFMFVGSGIKRDWLEQQIVERKLANVALLPPFPRTQQREYLSACHVAVVPLVPGMRGLGVPSRTYNLLAAGRPLIVLAHPESEIALLVAERRVGWVVDENRPSLLVETILEAFRDRTLREAMGERARVVSQAEYSREQVLPRFAVVVEAVRSAGRGAR